MSKPPRFKDRTKLTLQGERTDIADAHVFAASKGPSLSNIFWKLFLPRISKDKEKRPEAYGDRPQPATKGAK